MRVTTETTVLHRAIRTVSMDGVTSQMERVQAVFKDTQDRRVKQVEIQFLKSIILRKTP